MQMIVHHRKSANGDCEDFGKFLKPSLDPFLATLEESTTRARRSRIEGGA
jgi:hypothetical protein